MTIATTPSEVTLQGNGSTTSFAFNFLIPLAQWLVVIYTDAQGNQTEMPYPSSAYSVSGLGNPNGGTVTYPLSGSPIASGTSLTIQRVLPVVQGTSLGSQQAGQYPEVTEEALDYLTMLIQQYVDTLDRTLRAPAVDPVLSALPAKALRANMFLGFDAYGQPLLFPTVNQSASAVLAALASAALGSGPDLIGYQLALNGVLATNSVAGILRDAISRTIWVDDFVAIGAPDDTAAINHAIAFAQTLPGGAEVRMRSRVYNVSSAVNMANIASFSKGVTLKGAGRFASIIKSGTAGINVIDLIGSNDCALQDLNIDSSSVVSQCAILLARSTVNQNCNNNRIQNVNITGGYVRSAVVSIAAESTKWLPCCQIQNTHSVSFTGSISGGTLTVSGGTVALIAGQYIYGTNVALNTKVTGFTGGSTYSVNHSQTVGSEGMFASANTCLYLTNTNSFLGMTSTFGTIFTSSNTDNVFEGIEFYSPFNYATPVILEAQAAVRFLGCTIVAGSSNNVKCVVYTGASGSLWNGACDWYGLHAEVNGTGNVCHWLDHLDTICYFRGINSHGGNCEFSENTPLVDFDRTSLNGLAVLSSSTWETPMNEGAIANFNFYVDALLGCDVQFTPDQNGSPVGTLYVFSFIENCGGVKANTLFGPGAVINSVLNETKGSIPSTGVHTPGKWVFNTAAIVGATPAWVNVLYGSLDTLSGITGTGTSGSNQLTLNSVTGSYVGGPYLVAGTDGNTFTVRYILGSVAYLSRALPNSVSGAAVSYQAANFRALAVLT